jgi:hypothetical protein
LVSESPINNWITWLLLALLELFMVVTEVAWCRPYGVMHPPIIIYFNFYTHCY